ncbi:hypothetical protein Y032_0057g2795 [Ancylostoma ceylanicum]|nr:hypothetical protein Y032_0057g2795 [Ancylostoma ceylanicum]
MSAKKRGSVTSPLGHHKIEAHGGKDFVVGCGILIHESEISARKALEAAWILAKNPGTNDKNEYLSLTSDLLPLISL